MLAGFLTLTHDYRPAATALQAAAVVERGLGVPCLGKIGTYPADAGHATLPSRNAIS